MLSTHLPTISSPKVTMSVRSTMYATNKGIIDIIVLVIYVSFSLRIVRKTNVRTDTYLRTVLSLNTNSINPLQSMFYIENGKWNLGFGSLTFYWCANLRGNKRHFEEYAYQKDLLQTEMISGRGYTSVTSKKVSEPTDLVVYMLSSF